nr:vegetative cell wall protein gp1-like [Setaria viridis]
MLPTPSPPPAPRFPPATAVALPPPRILGRTPTQLQAQPPCTLSLATPRTLSSWERFFSNSPPLPPRDGRPTLLVGDWVPESPDPQVTMSDLRFPTPDPQPAVPEHPVPMRPVLP